MIFSVLTKNMEVLKKLLIVVRLRKVIVFLTTLLLRKASMLPRFTCYQDLTPVLRDLNECPYKGPQLTISIFGIFCCFWTFLIDLTSGIENTFVKVSVGKGDKDHLRFSWFENIFSEAIRIVRNRFQRSVFGVICSPFLLKSTIRKQNYDMDEEFIQKFLDYYSVDDFLVADTIPNNVDILRKASLYIKVNILLFYKLCSYFYIKNVLNCFKN